MDKVIFVVIGVLVILGIGVGCSQSVGNKQTQTCTVEEKDRTRDADGNSNMRIYTAECGVLEVGDNLMQGVFNSADLYSKIKVGESYEFTTVGYRRPILSHFPTITEVR